MNVTLRLGLIATVAITGYTAWKDSQQPGPDTPLGLTARAPTASGRNADDDARSGDAAAAFDKALTAPVDLFSARQWLKEPPKPPLGKDGKPVKVVVPPPVAPNLPFEFSGLWVEGPIRYVVVTAQGQQYLLCNQCNTPGSLHAGDTLLGQYRLESLDPNQAVFTYLPLKQRQSLMLESL